MARTDPGRRRFITRHDVEDAAAAGRSLNVGGRDTLTDEAAQRARDLGVTIERQGGTGGGVVSSRSASGMTTGGMAGGAGAGATDEQLRRAVRAAVVAELGSEPAGLDAAIDRVLARRRRGT